MAKSPSAAATRESPLPAATCSVASPAHPNPPRQRPPPRRLQHLRRARRFLCPCFRGSSRAHLPRRQIQNARPISALRHLQQRPPAGQLHIIRMRRNRQQIKFHRHHLSLVAILVSCTTVPLLLSLGGQGFSLP